MRERQFDGFQRIGRIQLHTFICAGVITFFLFCGACSQTSPPSADGRNAGDANAAIDSLNARISQAYRDHDPSAYAKQFTDTTVFEWPAINTVRGRPAIEEMVRS